MGQRKRAMFGGRLFLSSHHTLQISGGLKRVFALSGMHPDQQRIKNLNEKKINYLSVFFLRGHAYNYVMGQCA